MLTEIQNAFNEMDRLSEEGKPFFFLTDFSLDTVTIFPLDSMDNHVIRIEFPSFQYKNNSLSTHDSINLKAFPPNLETYQKGFQHVQRNIVLGNSYLANYTIKTPIEIEATLDDVFDLSAAKYKIKYLDQFVCFSPETFVEIKDNVISTHPMKGTILASLPNAANLLRNDEKEKAEHYTVVDLLRNDLSKVANNVQVKDFQRMDLITTKDYDLLGMSSEIEGNIRPSFQNKIGSILKELLPAGSILGAPKVKTFEIVTEAETFKRGFYTGVAGWFDGKNLDSCVMIRFIEKEVDQYFFKSGGGITHLSKVEDEYQEIKNKIYVPVYRKHQN